MGIANGFRRRDLMEDVLFYSGSGFLAGTATGATSGIADCLRYGDVNDSIPLRINQILNMAGHKGRRVGASMGILGLLYAVVQNGIVYVRGEDDAACAIVAGAGTGMIFKSATGPRNAAIAGAAGGLVAGSVLLGHGILKRLGI